MSEKQVVVRTHGNAYNLFILVLTIFSLVVMVLLLLPLSEQSLILLRFYDNFICLIFLADFAYNLSGSRPRRQYFLYERGWLDLLGSIPSFGFFQLTALFRLARLSRLARIGRLLGGKKRGELVRDMVENRGQYATFVTILLAGMVLSISSFLVLQFESRSPDANITTGGDAIWWGFVTITTVGYGDFYPVTGLGRLVGVSVMFAGVGIIGALASILASVLVPPPKTAEEASDSGVTTIENSILAELAQLRAELAEMRGLPAPDGATAAQTGTSAPPEATDAAGA